METERSQDAKLQISQLKTEKRKLEKEKENAINAEEKLKKQIKDRDQKVEKQNEQIDLLKEEIKEFREKLQKKEEDEKTISSNLQYHEGKIKKLEKIVQDYEKEIKLLKTEDKLESGNHQNVSYSVSTEDVHIQQLRHGMKYVTGKIEAATNTDISQIKSHFNMVENECLDDTSHGHQAKIKKQQVRISELESIMKTQDAENLKMKEGISRNIQELKERKDRNLQDEKKIMLMQQEIQTINEQKNTEKTKYESKIQQKEKQMKELNSSVIDGQQKISELESSLKGKVNEIAAIKTTLEKANQTNLKLEKEIKNCEERISQLESNCQTKQNLIAQMETEKQNLTEELLEKRSELESILKDMKRQSQEKTTEIELLNNEIKQTKDQMKENEDEFKNYSVSTEDVHIQQLLCGMKYGNGKIEAATNTDISQEKSHFNMLENECLDDTSHGHQAEIKKQQVSISELESIMKTKDAENLKMKEGISRCIQMLKERKDHTVQDEKKIMLMQQEIQTINEQKNTEKNEYESKLQQKEEQMMELNSSVIDGQQKITELESSLKGKLNEMAVIVATLEKANQTNLKLEKEMKNCEERISQLESQCQTKQNLILQRETEKRNLTEEFTEKTSELESKLKEMERQSQEKTTDITQLNKEIKQTKDQIKQHEDELKKLQNENDVKEREIKQIHELKKKIEDLTESLKKEIEDREEKERGIYETQKKGESLRNILQKTLEDIKEKECTIKEMRTKIEDLTKRLAKAMARKISIDESNIENISILNRPTNIKDEYDNITNNEWFDAKSCLDNSSQLTEKEKHKLLVDIFMISQARITEVYQPIINRLQAFHANVWPEIRDHLRKSVDSTNIDDLVKDVKNELIDQHTESAELFNKEPINKFLVTVMYLCLKMIFQTPQMKFMMDKIDKPFDPQSQELSWDSKPPGENSVVHYYISPSLYHGEKLVKHGKVVLGQCINVISSPPQEDKKEEHPIHHDDKTIGCYDENNVEANAGKKTQQSNTDIVELLTDQSNDDNNGAGAQTAMQPTNNKTDAAVNVLLSTDHNAEDNDTHAAEIPHTNSFNTTADAEAKQSKSGDNKNDIKTPDTKL